MIQVREKAFVVGEKIRFGDYWDYKMWWTVLAAGERYAVAARNVPFRKKGSEDSRCYTIIDVQGDVRGPCDWIGGGYGEGKFDVAECRQLLSDIERGICAISRRNGVPLRIIERRTK